MTGGWGLLGGAVWLVLAVARDVIAWRRETVRRASVERLVGRLGPGGRIVDRDDDGAVIDVFLGSEDAPQLRTRQVERAG